AGPAFQHGLEQAPCEEKQDRDAESDDGPGEILAGNPQEPAERPQRVADRAEDPAEEFDECREPARRLGRFGNVDGGELDVAVGAERLPVAPERLGGLGPGAVPRPGRHPRLVAWPARGRKRTALTSVLTFGLTSGARLPVGSEHAQLLAVERE